MQYLLDTDIINVLLDKDSVFFEKVAKKIKNLSENDKLFVSILSLYELEFSLSNAIDADVSDKIRGIIEQLKLIFIILPLDEEGASIYGFLKTSLQKKTGSNRKAMKKHNIDLMIASTAIENGCILVSRDALYRDHLQPINGQLKIEDWTI